MIVDLAELRLYLKVDEDTTVDDGLIIMMEAAAQEYLEHETGRYFGPIDQLVEVRSSFGWGPIALRAAPLAGVYPIIVERRPTMGGEWSAVGAEAYELEGNRLFPRIFWEPAQRSVRATYYGGWEEAAPELVRQAVREIVARMYRYRLPTIDETLTPLPASVHDVIRAYKTPVF